MSLSYSVRAFTLTSVSVLACALAACSNAPDKTVVESPAALSSMNAPGTLPAEDLVAPVTTSGADPALNNRIARLEFAVNSLREDYNKILPAFASLNTTNDRIQTLLDEVEAEASLIKAHKADAAAPAPTAEAEPMKTELAKTEEGTELPVATPPASAAAAISTMAPMKLTDIPLAYTPAETETAPKTEAPKETAPTPVKETATGPTVAGLRIGEHKGMTRLVFDLKAGAEPVFKLDNDPAEKILIVDMSGVTWSGADSGKPKSPLIESWSNHQTPTGVSTAFQLKTPVKVTGTQVLKAEGKDPARLVIDIAPAS